MAVPGAMPDMMGMGENPMATPGGPSPAAKTALSAMGGILPKQPHPTAAIQRMQEGLDLCHKILMSILPQITNLKPELGKNAHAASRMVLDLKVQLQKEGQPQPPPDLSFGMGPSVGASPLGAEGGGIPGGGISG